MMEIVYAQDVDTLAVVFHKPKVEESKTSRQIKLGRGIRAWVSEDGEDLYSLEVDGHASERVEVEKISITNIEGSETVRERTFPLAGGHEEQDPTAAVALVAAALGVDLTALARSEEPQKH